MQIFVAPTGRWKVKLTGLPPAQVAPVAGAALFQ